MNDTAVWAAPLILLPGVGLLILSTSSRFGQLHQELLRQRDEGHSRAVQTLVRRGRLLHSSLVGLYISVMLLTISSVLGTLINRWLMVAKWIPETLSFLGILVIAFSAIQLIRESKLLIAVILDAAGNMNSKA